MADETDGQDGLNEKGRQQNGQCSVRRITGML